MTSSIGQSGMTITDTPVLAVPETLQGETTVIIGETTEVNLVEMTEMLLVEGHHPLLVETTERGTGTMTETGAGRSRLAERTRMGTGAPQLREGAGRLSSKMLKRIGRMIGRGGRIRLGQA